MVYKEVTLRLVGNQWVTVLPSTTKMPTKITYIGEPEPIHIILKEAIIPSCDN